MEFRRPSRSRRRKGPPTFGRPGSVVGPQRPHRHCSPAPRPTLHDARPVGSGREQTLPRWLLPATDRPIAKDRTGPDLGDRPLSIISMSPNRAIRSDNSKFSTRLAAAQPLTIHSRPEARDATGFRRNTVELAITPLVERTSGSLSPRGRGSG